MRVGSSCSFVTSFLSPVGRQARRVAISGAHCLKRITQRENGVVRTMVRCIFLSHIPYLPPPLREWLTSLYWHSRTCHVIGFVDNPKQVTAAQFIVASKDQSIKRRLMGISPSSGCAPGPARGKGSGSHAQEVHLRSGQVRNKLITRLRVRADLPYSK
jgi:hypothetical protein